eukprot:4495594-Amphidinium_carterae.1
MASAERGCSKRQQKPPQPLTMERRRGQGRFSSKQGRWAVGLHNGESCLDLVFAKLFLMEQSNRVHMLQFLYVTSRSNDLGCEIKGKQKTTPSTY